MRRWFNDNRFLSVALSVGLLAACGDDDNGSDTADSGADTGTGGSDTGGTDTGGTDTGGGDGCTARDGFNVVCNNITGDTRWSGRVHLETLIFVENGTLTIDAGTVIEGIVGSALVVSRTGRIDAQGTATDPIVFTSARSPAERTTGDFGGVVLLGNAPSNVGQGNIEGMESSSLSAYGGNDPTHDCGTLRYVRIEYAGSVFGTDNELNALTLGGCGTDTVLEYIQVHKGLDDGIEFFGGTASLRYAVITQAGDDGLDWDEGWSGDAQFIVVQQADNDGDKGIEADNLGDNNEATPRSNPHIWNITLIGGNDPEAVQIGAHLRRGTAGSLNNVIFTGFPGGPVNVDGDSSQAQANDGGLNINHVMIHENGPFVDAFGEAWIRDADGFLEADPMLGAPFNLMAPDFVPAAGSPAANGGTPAAGFDTSATYYGAFEPGGADWTAGWTAYP